MHDLIHTYYSDVERIGLVQGNLNTHKYRSFYDHLPVAQARSLSNKLVFILPLNMAPDGRPLPLNMAEIKFSALARPCLNRRIGNLDELARQVESWTSQRNKQAVKVHWSFTVARAEDKLKRWYEQVNPVNKSKMSTN